jgi:AdoMet-dependent heme synthase
MFLVTDRDRFSASPLVVIWEVSRACDLACVHCRAHAVPEREPEELTTEEGMELIAEVKRFGKPLFVLTGGDPLKRGDVFDLIGKAADSTLVTFLSPSGTPLLTHAALRRAKQSGLTGVSISFDGSHEEIHDRFRGVRGSFRWSMEGAASAVALGLTLQINTTLTRHNLHDLPAIAELVAALEARRWTLFLLVPTGRATAGLQVGAEECERIFEWLHRISRQVRFRIKTTEGPHYRRVAMQTEAADSVGDPASETTAPAGPARGKFVPGVNDGSGFVFISSKGEIQPSGFLPLSAGNVRSDSLVAVYRDHPLFRALRDPGRLRGRCGRCEFRSVCGGSRARAYATSRDFLGEDPACGYQPEARPGVPAELS